MTAEAKRDVLAEFEAMVSAMSEEEKAELDKILAVELAKPWLPVPGPQSDAYYSKADILLYGGAAGGGKGLSVNTPIPTPSGFTSMGKLRVGDIVFSETGSPCTVLAISGIHHRPCFRLIFDDGSTLIADDVHKWKTMTAAERIQAMKASDEWRAKRRAKRPSRAIANPIKRGTQESVTRLNRERVYECMPSTGSVRSTRDLFETQLMGRRVNHSIDICGPIQADAVDLPIEPYTLGLWLGDGFSSSGAIGMMESDWKHILPHVPYAESARQEFNDRKNPFHVLCFEGFRKLLRTNGILGQKHIPMSYLRASFEQRCELLRGLLDTDGTVDARGQIEIGLSNADLAADVHHLIQSLGIKCTSRIKRLSEKNPKWSDHYRMKFMAPFDAFKLPRKLSRQRAPERDTSGKRYLLKVEDVPSEPTVCIAVDSPSKLFLAGRSFIPTHNSSLLVGVAMTEHSNSVIYRRAYADISGLEEEMEKINRGRAGYNSTTTTWRRGARRMKFEALEKPKAEESAQGKATTYIGLDEGAQLTVTKVRFVMGWLRPSKDANERCRMIIASNPPMGGEGEWMMEWFAPWLEPTFANPAEPGELRWAYFKNEDTIWVDGPGVTVVDGEEYTHMSRTFIPSKVDDNPYLKDTGYKGRIQNLPEPMRSKLLYGDFLAGRQDHEWQVIPSAWVTAANERWRRADPHKRRRMLALSADIALGGTDNLVISRLHEDNWFAPLEVRPGSEFGGATGSDRIASLLLKYRKDGADLSVDGTGGWAAGARSHLKKDHETDCAAIVFSNGSNATTSDGSLEFLNLRVEMYWKFREALDPELGEDLAIPPDPRLFAELTAQRYWLKSRGKDTFICMKPKNEQPVSPDRSDAVVMAWRRRNAWARKMAIKAQNKTLAPPVPAGPNSWMG